MFQECILLRHLALNSITQALVLLLTSLWLCGQSSETSVSPAFEINVSGKENVTTDSDSVIT